MLDPELHRRLTWLIGIRAVVGTVLLGGAIVARITSPGSFPVNPFFFLIALAFDRWPAGHSRKRCSPPPQLVGRWSRD